jgi:MoxR-like ATPase
VKKVKLLKCNAGIIVDGVPYGFERMVNSALSGDVGTVSNALEKNWAESALELMNNDLRPQLSQLQEQFAQTEHLFLSNDDLKLANKYLSQCEKKFNEVAVKVHNAKGLL